MENYNVQIIFEGLSGEYQLPHVQSENGSDLTDDKITLIEGNRADGAVAIPGGKRAQRITITGIIVGENYKEITDLMNTMKTKIDTGVATLTLKHFEPSEVNDWSYTVRRVSPIVFEESMRTDSQKYSIEFLVLVYT